MIAPSNQYIAVLDTCVLAPMPLCDALLRLADIEVEDDVCQPVGAKANCPWRERL